MMSHFNRIFHFIEYFTCVQCNSESFNSNKDIQSCLHLTLCYIHFSSIFPFPILKRLWKLFATIWHLLNDLKNYDSWIINVHIRVRFKLKSIKKIGKISASAYYLTSTFCRVNQRLFSGWILWLIKESWHFLSASWVHLQSMHFFFFFLSLYSFHRKQNKRITNYFSLFVTYFFFFPLTSWRQFSFLQRNIIFGLIQNNRCGFKLN